MSKDGTMASATELGHPFNIEQAKIAAFLRAGLTEQVHRDPKTTRLNFKTTVRSICAKVVRGELFEVVRPATLHGRPAYRFNTKSA